MHDVIELHASKILSTLTTTCCKSFVLKFGLSLNEERKKTNDTQRINTFSLIAVLKLKIISYAKTTRYKLILDNKRAHSYPAVNYKLLRVTNYK